MDETPVERMSRAVLELEVAYLRVCLAEADYRFASIAGVHTPAYIDEKKAKCERLNREFERIRQKHLNPPPETEKP